MMATRQGKVRKEAAARADEETNEPVSVHVGPRVLGLALLGEHGGHDGVELLDELDEGIVGQVLGGELGLSGEARIGLPEHSVTEARDDLHNNHNNALGRGDDCSCESRAGRKCKQQ